MANPYEDLSSLLDSTRQLSPEEVAELHLEQGFIERARAIYQDLVRQSPDNADYRRRLDWLARLASVERQKVIAVRGSKRLRQVRSVDATLRGVLAPGALPSRALPSRALPSSAEPRERRRTPAPVKRIVAVD